MLWEAKTAAETVRRAWDCGSLIETASATATGVTVSAVEHHLSEVVVTLSGGTNGTTASVVVTVTTHDGETLTETFLLPVRSDAPALANSARDVVLFALRRITGVRRAPTAAEADDALERLNDMLALWRIDGMDVGVALPLTLDTALVVPDEFLLAIKYNLAVAAHDLYSESPIPALTYRMGEDSKRLVANKLFAVPDLQFSSTLTVRPETVEDLF